MVIHQQNKREWMDFEPQGGGTTFSSESEKSTSNTAARKTRTTRGWMQEPIRTDDSLVPMELPIPVLVNPAAGGIGGRPPSPSIRLQHARAGDRMRPSSRGRQQTQESSSHHRRTADSPTPRAPKPVLGHATTTSHPQTRPRPPSRERASVASVDGSSHHRPPKTRGRSSSRTRTVPEQRERSISQTRSVGGASQSSHRSHSNRGRSRPPVTARNGRETGSSHTRGRSRSTSRDGRSRTARSRSASLTRVVNAPQPPPSPGIRSVKSASQVTASKPPAAVALARRTQSSHSRSSYNFSDSETQDANIGRDITIRSAKSGASASVCSTESRRKKKLMGLFGEQQQPEEQKEGESSMGDQIRPRVLLAATVYHNTATGLWITTINTNQKGVARDPKVANKYLKAFSFPSEQEARESAIANAPPKMVPFSECKECFLCKTTFTVFKRACHCRNCGVCICKDCSVQWPAKMIPDTYNLKNEAIVKVCRSCNTISRAFRRALVQGDYQGAVALYGTGNVNLRTPFPISAKKDELMWPVHCAVEGGNIDIVRWLVEDHFCPVTTIPSGVKKPRRGAAESLITTSAGRHVLSIAIEKLKVDIMQYLVADRGVSIYESKELEPSLRALEATLIALPRLTDARQPADEDAEPRWDTGSFDDMSVPSTIGVESAKAGHSSGQISDNASVGSKKNSECCIICYDRKIDCVATPCGHQVCCLECSANLASCPVCNHKGDFIKIFRP